MAAYRRGMTYSHLRNDYAKTVIFYYTCITRIVVESDGAVTLPPENNVGETGEDFLLKASSDSPSNLIWAHQGAAISDTQCQPKDLDTEFTFTEEFGPTDCYLRSTYQQDTSGPFSVRATDVIGTSYTAVVVAVGQKNISLDYRPLMTNILKTVRETMSDLKGG